MHQNVLEDEVIAIKESKAESTRTSCAALWHAMTKAMTIWSCFATILNWNVTRLQLYTETDGS